MKRSVSAIVGQGQVPYDLYRRLVRGCPSLVRSGKEAANACAQGGSRAVNASAVNPIIARQLPARWLTSSALGIGTADAR